MLEHGSPGGVLTEDGAVSSLTWGQLKNLILFKRLAVWAARPSLLRWVMFYHQHESIYDCRNDLWSFRQEPAVTANVCLLPPRALHTAPPVSTLPYIYPVGLMSSPPHDEAVTPPGAQTGDRDATVTSQRETPPRRHPQLAYSSAL